MTRRDSFPDLERRVEDLDGRDEFGPMEIHVIEQRVDQDGDVVEEDERVVEYECSGPSLTWHRTVVETGWEPDR